MRIGKFLALVLSLLCCGAAAADTRVELLGRVDFNGLSLGNCLAPPCPFTHVRPGEYVHVTFLVDNNGTDISSAWPDCPNQNPRTIGDTVYNIRNGTMVVRAAGTSLGVAVGMTSGGFSSPAFRMVNDNCAVDVVETEGAILSRGGRCCYANGSCTYVKQADCAGTWTIEGICTTTENSCTQPTGACCDFSDQCTLTTQAACSGTWSYGACTPGLCPQSTGACCFADGSCTITTGLACESAWFQGNTCTVAICPWPQLAPDYAMDWTIRAPKTLWTNATITDNLGLYLANQFDPNRSWTIIFQSSEMFIYDGFRMAFSTDTTPMGSCCPGDGHCLITSLAVCPVSASWTSGGTCGPTTCPAGSGACCKSDGSCELLAGAACAAVTHATYKGDNTVCATANCPATGACCNAGGCTSITQSACIATGGNWLGTGTSCAAAAENIVVMGNSAGRCCRINGECVMVYATACTGFGNTFTAGQTCDTPCPGAGSCCNGGQFGTCVVILVDNCINIGGEWTGAATCENACVGSGACCNPVAGSCDLRPQAGCPNGSTWTADTTCAAVCSTDTGKCCNTYDGSCRVTTQPFCSGVWTSGGTCAAPCTAASATFTDATFSVPLQTTIPATTTNSITIADTQVIQSVEVWMNVGFVSRVNDFRVSITGPNGTTLPLFIRLDSKPPACTATPVGAGHTMTGTYVFTDTAPISFYDHTVALGLGSGAPTVPGKYKPAGCGGSSSVLSAASPTGFGGIPASGVWTLTVVDERSGVNMVLNSWGLSFNGGNPAPCTIGKCVNGASCAASTFAQCTTGTWSTGACAPASPQGACCFLDTCVVMAQSVCPTGGLFVGNGTTCVPADICKVACCMADGTCVFTAPFTCTGTAGAASSTCSPTNTCPQRGACCVTASGACSYVLQSACTASGTTWSAGSSCSPNTCANQPAAPANNVCTTVSASGPDVVLSGGIFNSVGATLAGATADGVIPSCTNGAAAPDVWWRFTPPHTGAFTVQTCTSPSPVWDTVVSVWSDCATQVSGACGDDTCGTSPTVYGHASISPVLNSGATYLVRVGAFSPATTGQGAFTLNVTALGACCQTNGGCLLRAQTACTGTLVFQGVGTVCTPTNPCPPPRACCDPNTLQCIFTAPTGCTGGRIVGYPGSTCTVNPCPIPFCCRGTTCAMIDPNNCAPVAGSNAITVGECSGNTFIGCCYADYNHDGIQSIDDLFLYFNAYFMRSPFANMGGDGVATPTIDDLFLYINAYFGTCG